MHKTNTQTQKQLSIKITINSTTKRIYRVVWFIIKCKNSSMVSTIYKVIFPFQHRNIGILRNSPYFFPWNNREKLKYKKKWNTLKNSYASCKKGCSPVWLPYHPYARWPGWKSCEIQLAAKKWLWWSVFGNKFNSSNQVNFALILSEADLRRHTGLLLLKLLPKTDHLSYFLATTWISQLFILAILHRGGKAARLDRILFYSLHSCFWVNIH